MEKLLNTCNETDLELCRVHPYVKASMRTVMKNWQKSQVYNMIDTTNIGK